jgi:hypothetical protein
MNMATRKKRSDIIFPEREATMRDVVMFSLWAGVDMRLVVFPKPKKTSRKRKVDPKKPRA